MRVKELRAMAREIMQANGGSSMRIKEESHARVVTKSGDGRAAPCGLKRHGDGTNDVESAQTGRPMRVKKVRPNP